MPDETETRFETALEQLETIVASLERGEPELSAALAKYETGVRLLNQCYGLLERAERSVALLTGVDAQGNPTTAPFDATATIEIETARVSQGATGPTDPVAAPDPKPARPRRTKPPAATEPEHDRFDPPF
jgi:exodeoxyribonuclease VII small subunit